MPPHHSRAIASLREKVARLEGALETEWRYHHNQMCLRRVEGPGGQGHPHGDCLYPRPAALSDEGKGWLPPEVGDQARLVVSTFNEMLKTKEPYEEIVGAMDTLLDNLGAALEVEE